MTDQSQDQPEKEQVIHKTHEHYNPVTITVSDSVGAIALGILALALLVALLRAQAHNRKLTAELARRGS